MCINAIRNMGLFTYFKFKVGNPSRFAHFGMRIGECAQLWSCSHLVDHTNNLLILHVDLFGQRSLLGNKTRHSLVRNFFNCNNL